MVGRYIYYNYLYTTDDLLLAAACLALVVGLVGVVWWVGRYVSR